jgi:hypothetical protein
VAEVQAGVTTEVEVARVERDEQASVADLGLRLAEAKQITAALQAKMVPAQVTVVGERRRLSPGARRSLGGASGRRTGWRSRSSLIRSASEPSRSSAQTHRNHSLTRCIGPGWRSLSMVTAAGLNTILPAGGLCG